MDACVCNVMRPREPASWDTHCCRISLRVRSCLGPCHRSSNSLLMSILKKAYIAAVVWFRLPSWRLHDLPAEYAKSKVKPRAFLLHRPCRSNFIHKYEHLVTYASIQA